MSRRTLEGSCHCGAVAYRVAIDLTAPTIRCNCSVCTKSRAWIAPVPAADFRLSQGGEALVEYRFGPGLVTHCFCARCGIKTHGRLSGEGEEIVAVCVATLDLPPERLADIPVVYADGRRDTPDAPPARTAYL